MSASPGFPSPFLHSFKMVETAPSARCCGSVGLSAFLVFFQKSKDFQKLPNRFPGHLYLQVNQNSLCTEGRKRRKGLAIVGGLAKRERLQLQVEVILMVDLLLETCIVVVCFQASSKRFCQNQLYEIYCFSSKSILFMKTLSKIKEHDPRDKHFSGSMLSSSSIPCSFQRQCLPHTILLVLSQPQREHSCCWTVLFKVL